MTGKWDLSHVYHGQDDLQISRDLELANQIAENLGKYRPSLKSGRLSAKKLLTILQQSEKAQSLLLKRDSYAEVCVLENTEEKNRKFSKKMAYHSQQVKNNLQWIPQILANLSTKNAGKYLRDNVLSDYHHYIRLQRNQKPYTLPLQAELILQNKTKACNDTWLAFYQELTASFTQEISIEGVKQELSLPQLLSLRGDPRPEVRKCAIKAYHRAHADHLLGLKCCLDAIWKNYIYDSQQRNYPELMSPYYLETQVTKETLQAMFKAVQENCSIVQDYYRLKAKYLGYENTSLPGYDFYAPIGEPNKVPWATAKQLTIEALGDMSPEFGDLARYLFDKKLVEAENRKNKGRGGFAYEFGPGYDPVLFMTYDGSLVSVATLAHELGHAVHVLLLVHDQTFFNYQFTSPLVIEACSAFCEQLVIQKFKETTNDPKAELSFRALELEQLLALTFRQTQYVLWEKECIEKTANDTLSVNELCSIWNKHEKLIYGDSVEFLPEQSEYWAVVPHFVIARFLCLNYPFSLLLTLSLYQKYLKEGKAFMPKFTYLLRNSGRKKPIDLAAEVGLDITQQRFWQNGFDYMRDMVNALRAAM